MTHSRQKNKRSNSNPVSEDVPLQTTNNNHLSSIVIAGTAQSVSNGMANSNFRVNGDGVKVLGAVVGLTALVFSGIISGIYASLKFCKSMINVVQGYKVPRSLFRATSILGGGYGGAIGGGILGAMLGSAVPIIGTTVGFMIGTIFGAGLGSGIAGFFAKHLTRGISSLFHTNDISSTNPDKYRLTKDEITFIKRKGQSVPLIHKKIKKLKAEKEHYKEEGDYTPLLALFHDENIKKYNQQLAALKKGNDSPDAFDNDCFLNSQRVSSNNYYQSTREYQSFEPSFNRNTNSSSSTFNTHSLWSQPSSITPVESLLSEEEAHTKSSKNPHQKNNKK